MPCVMRGHRWRREQAMVRAGRLKRGRTAPGSPERGIVLASLENVRRAMAARLIRQPKP